MAGERTRRSTDESIPHVATRRWPVQPVRIVATSAFALHLCLSACSPSGPDAEPAPGSVGSRRVARSSVSGSSLAPGGTTRGGEGLVDLLRPSGLSPTELSHLAELVRPYVDPDDLPPGVVASYVAPTPGSAERIAVRLDRDRTLRFRLLGARWTMRLDSVPVTKDTVFVAGRVRSNLYSAALSGDVHRLSLAEKGDLAVQLSRVFAWQIDFFRDVRPRDAYRLVLERELRPDGSVRRSEVIAAEYMRAGSLFTALRFRPADEDRPYFYDEAGNALKGPFLKAPLDLIRVTSRFGGGRFHPLLGRSGTHRGIDYGAATGVPVHVTGDGTVERAGWWGDYGLVIEVRHGGDIRTRYAHLSAIEREILPGTSVKQGQTIGRVGSTGLSTAPHLHYEFLLRGIPTDPTRVDLPVERPIPEVDRERFARARAVAWRSLARVSWPGEPFGLLAGRRVGTGGHAGP